MWSKNPSPVWIWQVPFPSRFTPIRISVSLVLRHTSAVRSPAKRNSATQSQSVVANTHVSSSPFSVSRLLSGCSRMALQPKFFASSTSVARSPITKLPARSYSGLFRYPVSMPVRGLRVGALSSGKLRSIRMLSNSMPSFLNDWSIRLCTGQNVSSGKESVPNPSWLVTIASS